jgi:putative Mn2+ efflux pump MntP
LSGPDHLSALATLSANVDNYSLAFGLGVRWGIGHSTGLLIVGLVFLYLTFATADKKNDEYVEIPDNVTHVFEAMVGVFMLLLGVYGIWRALEKRDQKYQAVVPPAQSEVQADDNVQASSQNDSEDNDEERQSVSNVQLAAIQSVSDNDDIEIDIERQSDNSQTSNKNINNDIADYGDDDNNLGTNTDAPPVPRGDSEEDTTERSPCQRALRCTRFLISKIPTPVMALLAGILHGLAGPGGVLGVIPAIQLHNPKLATIYLACFCTTSTLTMGVFAIVFGWTSTHVSAKIRQDLVIELAASVMSIAVGIVWLILLSVGKLGEILE